MALQIHSPVFTQNGEIPARYSCEGENVSPPLQWEGVPEGTKSLVLIVDDPDAPDPRAPRVTWVHWVVYNLPVDARNIAENASKLGSLPAGALQGVNDWDNKGYGGPCPPIGRHRYFHKLYALDTVLENIKKPTKSAVESAMKGHVLAEARIIGNYEKSH